MKKNEIDISLLIPAYNEENNIFPLVQSIAEFNNSSRYSIEAVVVNDGSTDRTKENIVIATSRHGFIVHVDHQRNRGITACLITALNHSTGRYIVFFPADLQYRPECIPELIAPLEQGFDIVTGWKEGKYEKRVVSSLYNKLCRYLFHIKVHDLNSVKSMKREVLQSLRLRRDWHRYLVVIAAEMGYKIKEVRVKLYPRQYDEAKFTGKKRVITGFFDLLSVKFLISFSKKPLLFFGSVGLACLTAGGLIGTGAILARYFFQAGFRPLLYLVLLLVMVGVNLFALGFIAELNVILQERVENLESMLEDTKRPHDNDSTQ